ncbi:tRNA-specific 2-thiouridylase MnmA [Trichinella spiralis]
MRANGSWRIKQDSYVIILGSTGLRSNQLVYCSAKSFINYCSERNSADCGGLCIATGVAGVSVIKEAAHLAEKVYGASAACSFYIYKPAEQ